MTQYSPHVHALLLNITVMHHELSRFLGLWIASAGTVLLRPDMPTRLERCVLAHELGHATLGHTGTSPETEAEANRFAAALLVNPEKVELARERYGAERAECLARACAVSIEVMAEYLEHESMMSTWRSMLLEDDTVRRAHCLDWSTMGPLTTESIFLPPSSSESVTA